MQELETESRDYLSERIFFLKILKEAKARGMKYQDFANLVWQGEKAQPYRSLISLRKIVGKTGKPQALKLREAYRMAQILDLNLGHLAWEVDFHIDQIKSGRVSAEEVLGFANLFED